MEYPVIDPIAVAIGPLVIHWYGLMYVVGFLSAWWLGRLRADYLGLSKEDISDLIFYSASSAHRPRAGRLGNFINQELPGRVSDVPWALIFPQLGLLVWSRYQPVANDQEAK